ncbi:MAG: hypothetical protein M1504_00265 [Candidatus Marsarchaeota archaeon]|nr:hypothetical protein [Candidatus Marsarchaeota archaeon]
MDFYDIVSETCAFDESLAKRLGFKKIAVINKDITAFGHGKQNTGKRNANTIAFGKDEQEIANLVRGGANAVAMTGFHIDKKLMELIRDRNCVLCLPMTAITASYGIERSRNIYRIRKLFSYARSNGIEVSFASMAKTKRYLNSYVQLIELAKLVGADERYARHSIGEINKYLVNG